MPMQSALLGFAIFRAMQHRLSRPLTPPEIAVLEIIAGAFGLAPFASGFTSFIPALDSLTTKEDGGPIRFGLPQLLLWSVATCGPGIVVAAPFRTLFILRERLCFPSATATGTFIGTLFKRPSIVARAEPVGIHHSASLDPVDDDRGVYQRIDAERPDSIDDEEPDAPVHRQQIQTSNSTTIEIVDLSKLYCSHWPFPLCL